MAWLIAYLASRGRRLLLRRRRSRSTAPATTGSGRGRPASTARAASRRSRKGARGRRKSRALSAQPEQAPRPRRDDLRRRDDVHRPDDRLDRGPGRSRRTSTSRRPACSGSSTATCSRSRRCSPSAAGSPTSPATGAWSLIGDRHLRRPPRRSAARRPTGSLAETWLIVFRVIQGAGAAIMFPAALAIVVAAYPVDERGKALAIFFGDRRRPHRDRPAGRRLPVEWTWRAIFWVNIPVAMIATCPDAAVEAATTQAPGAARLPRRGPDRRSAWGSPCSACSSRAPGAGATRRPGARSSPG